MGTGRRIEVMEKTSTGGGAKLSFFLLTQAALFSVVVFAAVQHRGPEDSEEGVVSVPL